MPQPGHVGHRATRFRDDAGAGVRALWARSEGELGVCSARHPQRHLREQIIRSKPRAVHRLEVDEAKSRDPDQRTRRGMQVCAVDRHSLPATERGCIPDVQTASLYKAIQTDPIMPPALLAGFRGLTLHFPEMEFP